MCSRLIGGDKTLYTLPVCSEKVALDVTTLNVDESEINRRQEGAIIRICLKFGRQYSPTKIFTALYDGHGSSCIREYDRLTISSLVLAARATLQLPLVEVCTSG